MVHLEKLIKCDLQMENINLSKRNTSLENELLNYQLEINFVVVKRWMILNSCEMTKTFLCYVYVQAGAQD